MTFPSEKALVASNGAINGEINSLLGFYEYKRIITWVLV